MAVTETIRANLIQTINSNFPQCNYTTAHWRNEQLTCNERQSPIRILYTANITQPVSDLPDELQQVLTEMNSALGTVEGINLTIATDDEDPTVDALTDDLTQQPTRESEGTSSGNTCKISFYMLILSSILWYCSMM